MIKSVQEHGKKPEDYKPVFLAALRNTMKVMVQSKSEHNNRRGVALGVIHITLKELRKLAPMFGIEMDNSLLVKAFQTVGGSRVLGFLDQCD